MDEPASSVTAPVEAAELRAAPPRSPRSQVARWLPVGVWAALILVAGGTTILSLDGTVRRLLLRKAIHVGLYAVMALLLYRALAPEDRRPVRGRALLILALTAALGTADEWHQSVVRGRSGRLADVALDVLGGTVGLMAGRALAAIFGGPSRTRD